ncbi:MAG: DMT family transporter [Planktomarina sp.]
MMQRLAPYLWIAALGMGWGATQPMAKLAVSTGHGHFGLIFWQLLICIIVLGAVNIVRKRPLLMTRRVLPFYLVITLIGTIIPATASFQAIAALPAGVVSILLSLIPMMAFPTALALGIDQFSIRRLMGLSLGFCAVILIIGVPDALPDAAMLLYVPIGMIAPLMYALEGNFVNRFGTGGAGPMQLLLGASIVGLPIALALTLYTGQWVSLFVPWGAAEWGLIGSSAIHAIVYTCYVFVIGRYGAVFSVQVSYIVTLSGVGWAMWMLGERYSGPIWIALAIMLLGMYFVTPRLQDNTRD